VEGKDAKCRPVVIFEGEIALYRSEEGEPSDGRDQTVVFHVAVCFL